jgi:hypothetical protein
VVEYKRWLERETLWVGQPVRVIFKRHGLAAAAGLSVERADSPWRSMQVDMDLNVTHVGRLGP